MDYQVLARKWRPKKFSDVIGQQHVVSAITNSFSLRKIHHAYILIGMRGVGKTTIARLFAKSLNCDQGIIPEVCGKCKNCKDIELGCFIDLIEIDAASRTKVEETREFLNNVQYMPSRGRFKIYLIDEVHMLSKHSFNALLKMLEEPPAHVKFVLITTEYKKIPETVLSRCLQFYLKPLNTDQILIQLKHIFNIENINIDILALESLAYASKGSMRDALNLSEQAIILGNNKINSDIINNMFGIINVEYPFCLLEDLINGNIHNILSQINKYSILGINWDHLLIEMLIILKKIAVNQFSSSSLVKKTQQEKNNPKEYINQRIYTLSKRITPENIQLYYQILLLGRRELPYAPSFRIGVEMTMLRALAFKPVTDANIKNKDNTLFSFFKENSHSNHPKDSNISNDMHQVTNDHLYKKPLKFVNNHLLNVNLKNKNFDSSNNIALNNTVSSFKEMNEDTTKKLLEVRSMLSKYKESNELNKIKKTSNLTVIPQKKTIKNILKRFSHINIHDFSENSISCIDAINTNYPKHLEIHYTKNKKIFYENDQNVIPNFIKKIFEHAIKNDPWILQIHRLLLPKLAKKLAMNSWKEEISINKICLHLRSNYHYLNSIVLKNTIQKSFSKYMGRPIVLYIKEDDNTAIKTPIEYIRVLYKEKILKAKEELSSNSHIKMIKDLFDTEFNEDDIQVL